MAGGWGVCPPVKIVKMVRMVWACGSGVWGVCVPRVEMVNMVKIVKIVWACGWGGGFVPRLKW